MAKNPQQKDEALEALDFIVNVLKEHEHDLDKLINELATVTEQMGDTGELTGKVEKVEEKIINLQKEVTTLIGNISCGSKIAAPALVAQNVPAMAPVIVGSGIEAVSTLTSNGPSVILNCKLWEDFQELAAGAQTISFNYKEDEKIFQTYALKANQVISYSGPLPRFSIIMKAFLAKQLNVSERCILEGILSLR